MCLPFTLFLIKSKTNTLVLSGQLLVQARTIHTHTTQIFKTFRSLTPDYKILGKTLVIRRAPGPTSCVMAVIKLPSESSEILKSVYNAIMIRAKLSPPGNYL